MDKYNTLGLLGQGACGYVYQVVHIDTQRYEFHIQLHL